MADMSGRIYQMSGRGLLLNSQCAIENPKCLAELKSFWQSLKQARYTVRYQDFLFVNLTLFFTEAGGPVSSEYSLEISSEVMIGKEESLYLVLKFT